MRVFVTGQKAFGAAALRLIVEHGHTVTGVSSPPLSADGERLDRMRVEAQMRGLMWMAAGQLKADTLPDNTDLIVAAHSHDFISRRTRLKTRLGAIGYHPSLLPRHRGRDAVRWTVKCRDPIAGGSVYWLSDNMDCGDLAAQDWCWVYPDDTTETLWRGRLFPLGLRLLSKVLRDLARGVVVAVPQEESVATWEPSWDRPPVRRPDLLLLGEGNLHGFEFRRDAEALQVV